MCDLLCEQPACLFSALSFSFSRSPSQCFDLRFLISAEVFLGLWQSSLLEMNQPASLSDNNHNLELDLD